MRVGATHSELLNDTSHTLDGGCLEGEHGMVALLDAQTSQCCCLMWKWGVGQRT